jgi:hypothetical protein
MTSQIFLLQAGAPMVRYMAETKRSEKLNIGFPLWIACIIATLFINHTVHIAAFDGVLETPARIPLAILVWPAAAVLLGVRRSEKNLTACAVTAGGFALIVGLLTVVLSR